jgi:hypothetical protein
MAKGGLVVRVRIDGLRETIKAFAHLPKDATVELRAASLAIAEALAETVRTAAEGDSGQSALMAPTIRAMRDRVPAIAAGGARRVGSNKVPAFKVLFGSEFGSHSLKQYRPFNPTGYWFFSTVQANEDEIGARWLAGADEIVRKWAVD